MPGTIAKHTEISADSPTSIDDAITTAVTEAGKTLRGIRQFWVKDIVCTVDPDNHKITNYRVLGKVSFEVER